MFGAASAWAAVTIKEWIEKTNTPGTIRFYGTPAEEGGSGKVYMVREGLFKDVDVALHWHPGSVNHANPRTSNSNKSAKFTFREFLHMLLDHLKKEDLHLMVLNR